MSLEEAFRSAFSDALRASLAGLTADLGRIAARLTGRASQRLLRLDAPAETVTAPQPASPAPESPAEEPRACAVIGCRQPVRSLGYCAAHYQKRRLMVATGRLHRLWVEDAAPHSLPDVILSRRRRAETESTPAAEAAPAPASPRVLVRKKAQPEAPDASADSQAAASAVTPTRGPVAPQRPEDVTSTVARWAAEFKAGKRGS